MKLNGPEANQPFHALRRLFFFAGELQCEDRRSLPAGLLRNLEEQVQATLPREGWMSHHQGITRSWHHPLTEDVLCELAPDGGWGTEEARNLRILQMAQSVGLFYLQAVWQGALPFHTALMEFNGRGFLIAASGGTGKSTCSSRIPFPWQPLCDDEALILPVKPGDYRCHPFPTWSRFLSGRSSPTWDVQSSVPLAAVFFLQQAGEDEAIPLGQGRAAVSMYHVACQVSFKAWANLETDRQVLFRRKLFENAGELAMAVPAFILRARLDGRFWTEMERVGERVSE